jgi:hypothetical protein
MPSFHTQIFFLVLVLAIAIAIAIAISVGFRCFRKASSSSLPKAAKP